MARPVRLAELAGVERSGRSYALLADGTTLTIRPAAREDYEAVRRLHEAMSPDNLYFRFFTAIRVSAEHEARRVCLGGNPGLVALLGLLGDELAGVASYELTSDGAAAEIALAVADGRHRRGIATRLPVPAAAVVLDQPEAIQLLNTGAGETGHGPVPAYAYPEAAARALARAVRYGARRSRPAGTIPEFADLRAADARSVVTAFLARMPGGGWLSAEEADHLLRCYGIPVVSFLRVADADGAVAAAAGFGGHVAIKADVPGLLHRTAAGAVELDLHGDDEVRAAIRRLRDTFAGRLSGVLVEPMITGGIETIVGVVQEPVFGPVVVFGLGGVATEVLGDHAARLAPLTGADADDLIRSIRAAPVLFGHGGQAPADIGALRDTLLRVSRLADDLPQVTELDLNPVIARPDGVIAVDARIRVTSHRLADPFLRQLPQ